METERSSSSVPAARQLRWPRQQHAARSGVEVRSRCRPASVLWPPLVMRPGASPARRDVFARTSQPGWHAGVPPRTQGQPERERRAHMDVGTIIAIAAIVLLAVVVFMLVARRKRAERHERRREEAHAHREEARVRNARADRAAAEAEERAARARREQAIAEEQATAAERERRFANEKRRHRERDRSRPRRDGRRRRGPTTSATSARERTRTDHHRLGTRPAVGTGRGPRDGDPETSSRQPRGARHRILGGGRVARPAQLALASRACPERSLLSAALSRRSCFPLRAALRADARRRSGEQPVARRARHQLRPPGRRGRAAVQHALRLPRGAARRLAHARDRRRSDARRPARRAARQHRRPRRRTAPGRSPT